MSRQTKGGSAKPETEEDANIKGKNYLLVIGINDYEDTRIQQLKNPISDIELLQKVLIEHYDFQVCKQLTDGEATSLNIRAAIEEMETVLTEHDNFVMFYSGHGFKKSKNGYLVPYDGKFGKTANYITFSDLNDRVDELPMRHFLFILDCCYAGSALKKMEGKLAFNKPSRRIIAACDPDETAEDGFLGKNSPFTSALAEVLQQNEKEELPLKTLFAELRNLMEIKGIRQVPVEGLWKMESNRGGEFLFKKAIVKEKAIIVKENQAASSFEIESLRREVEELKKLLTPKKEILEEKEVPKLIIPTTPNIIIPTRKFDFEPDLIFVEGGTFKMGSNDYYNLKPIHDVTLDSFSIGKYPITQAQWKAVMGNNPSHFKGDNLPVEMVSWEDVQEFIKKLNAKTLPSGGGGKYRLPTEAEWEYAARGGQKSQGFEYSGSNNLDEVAWYNENSDNKMHKVGSKKSNELGIYDMSGNVWEWCEDWYDENYYKNSPSSNPTGATSGEYRVLRGGSWDFTNSCRVADRVMLPPSVRFYSNGFRVCLGY